MENEKAIQSMNTTFPSISDDGMVYYGDSGLNILRSYSIQPTDYQRMHETLIELGLTMIYLDAGSQSTFLLYCHALHELDADVKTLIQEFNKAQKGGPEDVRHALSLSKLFFHYSDVGCQVEIVKAKKSISTPDLKVNGISCELKVRLDQHNRRMQPYFYLLKDGKNDEYNEIYFREIRSMQEDFEAARGSIEVGFSQGDCVILDLSDHFDAWNYYRLESLRTNDKYRIMFNPNPINPCKDACILFSPVNAIDLNEARFNPRALWGILPMFE